MFHISRLQGPSEDPTLGQVFQSFLRPQVAQLAQRVTAAAAAAQQQLHSFAAQHGAAGGLDAAGTAGAPGVGSPSAAQQAQHGRLGGLVAGVLQVRCCARCA